MNVKKLEQRKMKLNLHMKPQTFSYASKTFESLSLNQENYCQISQF